MSLSEYKKKRSFSRTPEPAGKKAGSEKGLRFVVQKHDASRLHYDFRLEMDGVLKSWAIPKGPSLNPADKRLAMMVEDHPYNYKDFEGIIPEGNYGAGTVIVWDHGFYEPLDKTSKKKPEQLLLDELKKGSVKIIMHGEKLKGEFALVHIKSKEDNAWLLIKHNDEYASATDVSKKNKSVVSGLKIEEVAKTSKKEWHSNRTEAKSKKTPAKRTAIEKSKKKAGKEIISGGKPAAFPKDMKPMLASLTGGPFDDPGWIYEIKWDGYRALAYLHKGNVELRSRNNLSFNKKFYPVAEALQQLDMDAVLDGEIVSRNEDGKSDFQQLQAWQKTGRGQLDYYVFDILWLNGKTLTDIPLIERKKILEQVILNDGLVKYSEHIEGKGTAFFKAAIGQKLEGIMAKKADSSYIPGTRTKQWLKIKTHQRQEVVIAGFTKARNSRSFFGALVLGIYKNKKLVYVGHTGSGFNEKGLADVYKKLKPLVVKECPFAEKPKTNMPSTWVKPALVCEIEFTEWTQDGFMRHPIFVGLRIDKKATEVKKEEKINMPVKKTVSKAISKKAVKSLKKSPAKKIKKLVDEESKEEVITVDKQELTFTNLNKIYWPNENISKADVINYYHEIAGYIIPYMKDRPQSLNRHPNGINGMSFYQKDVTGKIASWISTYGYTSESDGEKKKFLVCTDEASLLYMANLGCIEMNPWHSRIKKPDNPDWCIIDLDPDTNSFNQVIEAAQMVRQILESIKVPCYCKTSGSTGIHIYIPLGAKYSYDQSRLFAQLVVTMVQQELPAFTSIERTPSKRKGLIYLDFLQNRSIQTIAAPYSLRPKPGATVSTPLHWEEVKKGLRIGDFTISNIFERLKDIGEIFTPVLGKGIDLKHAILEIQNL